MKQVFAVLLLTAAAMGQSPSGRSLGWSAQTTCQNPAEVDRALCATDDKKLLISVNGSPYQDPANFAGGAQITIGITTTLPAGAAATASLVNGQLNLGIPQGKDGVGSPGPAGTIAIGSVTTLAAGAKATVQNVGTPSAAIFNFGIPQGIAGTGSNLTSFSCGTFSGVPSIGTNGVWTFTAASGTTCNFK